MSPYSGSDVNYQLLFRVRDVLCPSSKEEGSSYARPNSIRAWTSLKALAFKMLHLRRSRLFVERHHQTHSHTVGNDSPAGITGARVTQLRTKPGPRVPVPIVRALLRIVTNSSAVEGWIPTVESKVACSNHILGGST
eukprot:scaffold568_cov376-Prasinococcus_capsulatus_cf.AAC.3